ncbi:MAG: dTDP-glucose 4,6-dehydratase [Planctomycetota bacterium]|nr:dTDP-glucose 4,6-dehydratase [Planctomycetota bacterium]MEC8651318.1 dTDP-glucose 4,6-dehydratase [Planctomycetota bacterium]MEC9047005.1 dTDP-glucose 4,6-dehydratase [Planctomycetota bacterium]
MSKILVTGGAGFIGSNFVRMLLAETDHQVVNLDLLTYAGNLENLSDVDQDEAYAFVRGDIADPAAMAAVFEQHRPDAVVHFAAESHVDRSVLDATAFVQTNVVGTQVLLDQSRHHGVGRFVHVSTDEVYGSLGPTGLFTEETPIQSNSPYSSSKAGSDLLVRAAVHTHGMDCVVTRCSNNYGPFQFPEKLIPLMIANALEDKPLPIYGDGKNVRDWIHVADHCRGILSALDSGERGEVYNFGGDAERENLFVVHEILRQVGKGEDLITYVTDRPGHDRRYAMDSSKAREKLGWTPSYTFEEGLRQTVEWYLANQPWWERVRSGAYQEYYDRMYGAR